MFTMYESIPFEAREAYEASAREHGVSDFETRECEDCHQHLVARATLPELRMDGKPINGYGVALPEEAGLLIALGVNPFEKLSHTYPDVVIPEEFETASNDANDSILAYVQTDSDSQVVDSAFVPEDVGLEDVFVDLPDGMEESINESLARRARARRSEARRRYGLE